MSMAHIIDGRVCTNLGADHVVELGGVDLLQAEAHNDDNRAAHHVALLVGAQLAPAVETYAG
jgi:hypothetical protein